MIQAIKHTASDIYCINGIFEGLLEPLVRVQSPSQEYRMSTKTGCWLWRSGEFGVHRMFDASCVLKQA